MPLEIRNIAIQMHVSDDPAPVANAEDSEGPLLAMLSEDHGDPEQAQAALIDQCVEAVLAELARRGDC